MLYRPKDFEIYIWVIISMIKIYLIIINAEWITGRNFDSYLFCY